MARLLPSTSYDRPAGHGPLLETRHSKEYTQAVHDSFRSKHHVRHLSGSSAAKNLRLLAVENQLLLSFVWSRFNEYLPVNTNYYYQFLSSTIRPGVDIFHRSRQLLSVSVSGRSFCYCHTCA